MRALLGFVFFVCALPTWAGLTIEINRGVDNPTPVAVVPFAGTLGLPENVSNIISADLRMSGLFRLIPQQDMLSMPTKREEVFYRDWRRLGISFLVIGELSRTATGGYSLHYELFDVPSQKVILAADLSGSADSLRDIAHRASDAIYEKITGIPGIFSTKIIYIEDLGRTAPDQYHLVHSDVDGERAKILMRSNEPILSPSWSPDGKSIAFVSFETSRPAIYTLELATGRKEQITNFKGLNSAPAWSPDGKQLAMVLSKDGNPEIYIMDLATRKLRRFTNKEFAIDTEPNWSSDGKSIIFTSNRGGAPQIYQKWLNSGRIERLTFDGNYNARPRVTRDGKGLIMVHREQGVFHIALQDIASGDLRILTRTHLDESPSIAPNGALLMYATRYNNKGVLAVVSMDAGVKFRLPSKLGDVREPAWSPYTK